MPHWTRRRICTALAATGSSAVLAPSGVLAAGSSVVVPESLQAKLVAKVAAFDRNMPVRAKGEVRILVLERPAEPESVRSALRLKRSLGSLPAVGGLPVRVSGMRYSAGAEVAETCRAGGVAIVYLTPGLDDALEEIAYYLSGMSILSVSAVPDHVYLGTVLAFDLVEGKPEILVHLARSKAQLVDFKASFLKLARIVDR